MNTKNHLYKNFITLIIVILLIIVGFFVVGIIENAHQERVQEQVQKDTQKLEYYEYNGNYYKEKSNIQVILCVGLDTFDSSTSESYRNNKLADCIILLVLDKTNKTIQPIQINRDTMTSFHVLGIGGRITNDTIGQIALSHSYGKGDLDSLQNVRDAVSDLMCEIKIDNYISLTMDAVATINDKAGGIKVLVQDDFSSIDPSLVQGEEVLLKGDQALTFVRARQGLDDPSNINRLNRQKVYLRALYETCKQKVNEDSDFVRSALDSVEFKSSESLSGLTDIGNTLLEYELLESKTLKGEAIQNDFIEFYPDDTSLKELCIETFYRRID